MLRANFLLSCSNARKLAPALIHTHKVLNIFAHTHTHTCAHTHRHTHTHLKVVAATGALVAAAVCTQSVVCETQVAHTKTLLGGETDFEDGELYEVKVFDEKEAVLLTKIDGKFYCTGNKCSHYSLPLSKGVTSQQHVTCPFHAAEFDVETGLPIAGPGLDGIPTYPITVENGQVFAHLPNEMQQKVIPKYSARYEGDKRVFVIVGAGITGLSAAETLRKEGYTGRIILIGKEKYAPYDRPTLSKNFDAQFNKCVLRDETFLKSIDVEFTPNTVVKKVDHDTKTVTTHTETKIRYDKVLIATGASPRRLNVPGCEAPNVYVIRQLSDLRGLSQHVGPDRRVVVVGTGFVGMEAATAALKKSALVSILGETAVPFEQIVGTRVGTAAKKLMEASGVKYYPSQSVTKFILKKGEVRGVELKGGEVLQADVVVLGVGAELTSPDVPGVQKNSDGSFSVDSLMKVNGVSDVYAAGDIATFPYSQTGESVRIEHWNVALQQGMVAAKSMMGGFSPYNSVPFFWSNIFGKSLRYTGHAKDFDDVVIEGDLDNYKFVAYLCKGERVLAVITMGDNNSAVTAMEAIKLNLMPTRSELRLGTANFKTISERLKASSKRLPKQHVAPSQ